MARVPRCPKHHTKLVCITCEGEKYGSRGGMASNANLTPAQRRERAKRAANARWGNANVTEDAPKEEGPTGKV